MANVRQLPAVIFQKLPDAYGAAEVDGEIVLICASTGEFFAIKGTGVEIWHLLDDPQSVEQMVESLTSEFEIDQSAARTEVEEFLGKLEKLGFVCRGELPA